MSYGGLEKPFVYGGEEGSEPLDVKEVRILSRDLFQCLMAALPDNRERSLAVTKLEETLMWAKASIAKR